MKYFIQVEVKEDGIGFVDMSSPTNRAGFSTISDLVEYALAYNLDVKFYNVRVVSREYVEKVV